MVMVNWLLGQSDSKLYASDKSGEYLERGGRMLRQYYNRYSPLFV